MRNDLSDVELLIIDDFLTVGIDPEAANDLFAVLANTAREINIGELDMRRQRDDQARATTGHWE